MVIASLAGTRLITQFVSPAILGPVSLLLGVFAFGKSLTASPILSGELSFYPELVRQGKVWNLRKAVMPMLGAGATIFTLAALILGWIWCRAANVSFVAIVILCAMMWLDSWRNFETNLISMARRQRLSSWLSALENLARPAAIVAITYLWSATPQAVVLGNFGGVVAPFTFLLLFARREGLEAPASSTDASAVRELQRQLMRFAVPLIPMAILAWIVALSDRYIIEAFCGYERVGVYAATYGLISQGVTVGPTLVARVIQPIYYKAVADGNVGAERSLFNIWLLATMLAAGIALAGVLVLRFWIAHLLLAAPYRSGINLMGWIAGGYALWSLACVCEARLYAHKQTSRLLVAYGIAGVFAVGVPLALVPKMGIVGAAIACPIYFATMLMAEVLLFRRNVAGAIQSELATVDAASAVSRDIVEASEGTGSL